MKKSLVTIASLLLSTIFLISCARTVTPGNYTSTRVPYRYYPEMLLHHSNQYSLGVTLTINSDGSFRKANCTNYFGGTWTQKGSTLLLQYKYCKNKKDSLNAPYPVSTAIAKCQVRRYGLLLTWKQKKKGWRLTEYFIPDKRIK